MSEPLAQPVPAATALPASPPNLGQVITAGDVSTKGTGKYSADYVNWCRIAHLMHVHAPGWQFHLRATADGQHVWAAPNGTGYVVGYFTGPQGEVTPDFPQAVMNNYNQAMPLEQIGARDVTDTHRRCLCTAAAATFGLAWQLWAREPLEDPHRPQSPEPSVRNGNGTSGTSSDAIKTRRDERTPQQLAEAANAAIHNSNLTQDGIRTLLLQFGGPQVTGINQLPVQALRSIPKLVQYSGKVSLLNRGLDTRTEQQLLSIADNSDEAVTAGASVANSTLSDHEDVADGDIHETEPPMAWAATAAAQA